METESTFLDRPSQLELSCKLGPVPSAVPSDYARAGWEITVQDCAGKHVLLQFLVLFICSFVYLSVYDVDKWM